MRLIHHIKRKKYFYTIYFITTISTLTIVSIFLWTLYFQVYHDVYEREVGTNIQLLGQVKSSINNTCKALEDACFSIYNSNEVQSIMYSNDTMDYNTIKTLNRISQTFVDGTPYVHSIYIYNKGLNTYFSTYRSMFNIDEDFLQRQIEDTNVALRYMPTIRKIDDQIIATYYLNDDYYYHSSKKSNAIYINFDFQWINEHIENLNQTSVNQELLIIDSSSKIIRGDKNETMDYANIHKQIDDYGNTIETFEVEIEGINYFATYMPMKHLGWKLIKMEPYNQVFSTLKAIKSTILIIFVSALLTISGIFILITRRLYKPVERMVKNIGRDHFKKETGEFSFIEEYYQSMKSEIDRLELHQKETWLRDLLRNANVSLEEMDVSKESLNINPCNKYILLYMHIDDYHNLGYVFDLGKDQELISFTLCNIISEIMEASYIFDYVPMDQYNMALVIQWEHMSQDTLIGHLHEMKQVMKKLLNVSFTIGVSQVYEGNENFHHAYEDVCHCVKERFVKGKGCIILQSELAELNTNQLSSYSYEKDSLLFGAIEKGYINEGYSYIEPLMKDVAHLPYAEIQQWARSFRDKMSQLLYEVNEYSEGPIIDVAKAMSKLDISKMDYLQDFKNSLYEVMADIQVLEGKVNIKQMKLLKDIKSYVLSNYMNPDLSMTDIGEAFERSSSYIGKLFKAYEGITLTEFLNDVRLIKSLDWMKNTRLPITSIIEKVGYRNESYFFRLFKKKFNTTPRKYMDDIREKNM